MFPLTAKDIQEAKPEISARQQAAAVMPSMSSVEGVQRVVMANTALGEKGSPPNVRLGVGVVSSVVFTDAKGKVWPISSYVIGDDGNFNVNWDKKSGILMMQSKKPYANTNMSVMLQGRATPITLMVQSTQKEWDYELYVRVAGNTQDNELSSFSEQPSYMLSLLSGISPQGAKKLKTSDVSGRSQFWRYQDHYLILTSGTLISPRYIRHIEDKSSGVVNVYEINVLPQVLISDDDGLHKINIEDQ
nr:DotH/IcmK family type IV secretion protein [Cysteiniphilum sp. 19X3-34]